MIDWLIDWLIDYESRVLACLTFAQVRRTISYTLGLGIPCESTLQKATFSRHGADSTGSCTHFQQFMFDIDQIAVNTVR